jgi:hypothetical protein
MEEYKKSSLWKNAYRISKGVHQLTKGAPRANTLLRLLRESSEGLVVVAAISLENNHDSYKEIFDHAHTMEHLLFLSLFFNHVKTGTVGDLFTRIHAIKRSLIVSMGKAKVS